MAWPPQEARCSHAAHPLALIAEEVELTVIGGGRQIGKVERHARAMQEHIATNAAKTGTQGVIDFDSVGPRLGIVITHVAPARIVVEWTADARALRRDRIAMSV